MRQTVTATAAPAVGDGPGSAAPSSTRVVTLTVAVLTFRRVDQLRRNLPVVSAHATSLSEHEPQVSVSVLVIDNDPAESARDLILKSFPTIGYVAEPVPGIAAARNRALQEASDSDLLIFIDDDERPQQGWLPPLIETWRASGAAAVPGRVVPHYETAPDPWILSGRFFDRPQRATGTRMPSAAAGNLLLDLHQLRQSGLLFEEPFGATGGEDSLLGYRLVGAGRKIVWCAESVVEDLVPTERLTRRWVLQRAYSQGNLQALIDCHLADGWRSSIIARARRAAAGAVYLTSGAARAARGYATADPARQADGLRGLCRGAGMFTGLAGRAYAQYARPDRSNHKEN